MDHTSLVFLMSDSNQFLDIVNTAVSEKECARLIVERIERSK